MADIWVDGTNGSDAYDGTRATFEGGSVGPKATALAGNAAVPNGSGGHRVIVAPGFYEGTIVSPAYAGVNGDPNIFLCDTAVEELDGSGNPFGVDPGYVVSADLVLGTSGKLDNYGAHFSANSLDYWEFKGLYIGAINSGILLNYTTGGMRVTFSDCIIDSGAKGIWCLNTPTGTGVVNIVFNRCYIRGSLVSAFDGFIKTTGGFPGSPEIVFNDCFLESYDEVSSRGVVDMNGTSVGYTWLQFNRCTFMSSYFQYGIHISIVTYNKADTNDCLWVVGGDRSIFNDNGTHVDGKLYPVNASPAGLPTGITAVDVQSYPFIRDIPRIWESVYNGGTVSGTDIHGRTRANEVGAEEFAAKKLPKYPVVGTGILQLADWDAGGGGGGGAFPIVGGMIVRAK